MKNYLRGILLLMLTILLSACGSSGSSQTGAAAQQLTAIIKSSAPASIHVGTSVQYTVYGVYGDGTSSDITNTVTWTSSDPTIASLSATGVVTGVSIGNTTIVAQISGYSISMNVAVTAGNLTSIQINPLNPNSYPGLATKFVATGFFDDGISQDISLSAAWSASQTAIATIDSTGLATAAKAGQTAITATLSGISASTNLTINSATLQSVLVTPASPVTMHVGIATQFSATGVYSDGGSADLTSSAQTVWSANSANVTINSSSGLASGVQTGAAIVTATYGTQSGSASVTVNTATPEALVINAPAPTALLGTNVQYTAQATFSDGTKSDVTKMVTWSFPAPTTAAIINQNGLLSVAFNATPDVALTVNATYLGTLSASVALQVTGGNANAWTFIGGSQTSNAPTSTSAPIWPSARNHAAFTVDGDGNFWLLGGTQFNGVIASDLWKYDMTSNIHGWTPQANIGIATADGAAFYYKDPSSSKDSIYVFGGWNYTTPTTVNNSLWKYDIASNVWSELTPKSTTYPKPRQGHHIVAAGGSVFYLFGGGTRDSPAIYFNDLWKFDAANESWTEILPNVTTPAIYGTQGVANINNQIPARIAFNMWFANGKVWIYGGGANISAGGLSDLWSLDPSTKEQTWVSGNGDINIPGFSIAATYGQLGIPSSANNPGARAESNASWVDVDGNLWMTSGYGSGIAGLGYGSMNDVWRFNPNSLQWTWMGGNYSPNTSTVYSILASNGANNGLLTPSGRLASAGWLNPKDGSFWLFGGYDGLDISSNTPRFQNDLWRYGK